LTKRLGGKSPGDPDRTITLVSSEKEMPMEATWKPNEQHGQLDAEEKNDLPDSAYAFPDKRKEPLTDAKHVRNAIARFNQVEDVTDAEREQAFANIERAARHYDVDLSASNWRELGKPS
jgi:cell division protein FtsX